jgi:hypothetical protein
MNLKEQLRGRVFDIQRASLQDGPGIRTTVFLNDSASHFEGIRQIETQYPGLRGIELIPYRNLGIAKGNRVGRAAQAVGFQVAGQSMKDEWMRQLSELGCRKAKLA